MKLMKSLGLALVAAGAVAAFAAFSPLAAPSVRAAGSTPTFTKDVAPILYKRCAECHRPNAIAPMALLL